MRNLLKRIVIAILIVASLVVAGFIGTCIGLLCLYDKDMHNHAINNDHVPAIVRMAYETE